MERRHVCHRAGSCRCRREIGVRRARRPIRQCATLLVLLVAMIAVSLAKAVVPAGPCPIRKTLFSRICRSSPDASQRQAETIVTIGPLPSWRPSRSAPVRLCCATGLADREPAAGFCPCWQEMWCKAGACWRDSCNNLRVPGRADAEGRAWRRECRDQHG